LAELIYRQGHLTLLPPQNGQRRGGHVCILVIAWHWLSKHTYYQELGSNDFDQCHAHAYRLKLMRTLEALGLKVAIEPTTSVSEASSFS